jgi:hypothetical protein
MSSLFDGPTLALTREGKLRHWYVDYAEAERAADQYRNDMQPTQDVYVIEHLHRRNFAVVIGWSDMPGDNYCDDYEIRYTA